MKSNSREIAKLKKKYSRWPGDTGFAGFKTNFLTWLPPSFTLLLLKKFLVRSEYKLKRESIKFFHLSNRSYGDRRSRKSVRLLVVAIELLGSNFPKSYSSLLSNAMSATFKDSTSRNSMSNSVLIATRQLEHSTFDATGWYQLSRGLFSLGYFRAAWVARENSLDFSIVEGSKPSR